MSVNYDSLKLVNKDALSRRDLGDSLNFEFAATQILKIAEELSHFQAYESKLSNVERIPILEVNNDLFLLIRKVIEFQGLPVESLEETIKRRRQLIDDVSKLKKDLNEKILPILVNFRLNDERFRKIIESNQNEQKVENIIKLNEEKLNQIDNILNTKIKNFDIELEQKISLFNKKVLEANSLLQKAAETKDQIENITIKKLTEKYGVIFDGQAKKNRNIASVFGGLLILSLFVLLRTAFSFFSLIQEEIKNIQSAETQIEYVVINLIFRLVILGIAFIFVKETLKNFNINMHLYTLNSHRHNAILSFNTLIDNVNHGETKDQIIREISQTIYANQDDGYLHTDKKTMNFSEIIDLIKVIK